jgi:hypothetical protein
MTAIEALFVVWVSVLLLVLGCERREQSTATWVPPTMSMKVVPGLPLNVKTPERITLYSLDFRYVEDLSEDKAPYGGETFHEYPVLGKVEITEAEQRRSFISALNDAIRRAPQLSAACFWPRHGLRAIEDGKTYDYVICFQCDGFLEYVDGAQTRGGRGKTPGLLHSDSVEMFDSPLVQAGIQIVPR